MPSAIFRATGRRRPWTCPLPSSPPWIRVGCRRCGFIGVNISAPCSSCAIGAPGRAGTGPRRRCRAQQSSPGIWIARQTGQNPSSKSIRSRNLAVSRLVARQSPATKMPPLLSLAYRATAGCRPDRHGFCGDDRLGPMARRAVHSTTGAELEGTGSGCPGPAIRTAARNAGEPADGTRGMVSDLPAEIRLKPDTVHIETVRRGLLAGL